jgi:hypothetical protein
MPESRLALLNRKAALSLTKPGGVPALFASGMTLYNTECRGSLERG